MHSEVMFSKQGPNRKPSTGEVSFGLGLALLPVLLILLGWLFG
jgi:hypothetical protein